MTRRRKLFRALGALPGAVSALLPSATCSACLAAYTGVLSTLGLGVLLREEVLAPLIVVLLVLGVVGVAWSSRVHRRLGPLVATLAGSGAVVLGRLVWRMPGLLYGGVALIFLASLWNLWLQGRRGDVLVQIDSTRTKGGN